MSLEALLEKNHVWADRRAEADPDFFPRLARQQDPDYLWIGCSDSRVPANEIVGLDPGELFVHRNIANLVVPSDLNVQSVLQYAVDVLKVEHVIVCGHYGCGGVRAAVDNRAVGLVDYWVRPIKDLRAIHAEELEGLDDGARVDRLCELNVQSQVTQVASTPVVQAAWAAGRPLSIHGWIYGLGDGRLRDLGVSLRAPSDLEAIYRIRPAQR